MSIETLFLLLFLVLAAIILGVITRLVGMVVDHAEQINETTAYILDNVSILKSELMTPADKQPGDSEAPAPEATGPGNLQVDRDLDKAEDEPNVFNYDQHQDDDDGQLSFRDRAAINEFLQPGQTKVATLKDPRPIGAVIRKTQGNESAYAEIVGLSRLVNGSTGVAFRYKLRVLNISEYNELVNVSGTNYKKHRGRKLPSINEQVNAAEQFKAKHNLL